MLDLAGLLVAASGLDRTAGTGAIDENALLAMRFASFGKSGIDRCVISDIHFAEDAANIGSDRFAFFFLKVENRDFGAFGGKCACSRFTKAGCAAGDYCGGICTNFHVQFLFSNLQI